MTTREQVWLEAWKSLAHGTDASILTIEDCARFADACLKAFDERFPQPDPNAIPPGEVAPVYDDGPRVPEFEKVFPSTTKPAGNMNPRYDPETKTWKNFPDL